MSLKQRSVVEEKARDGACRCSLLTEGAKGNVLHGGDAVTGGGFGHRCSGEWELRSNIQWV
ncbi:hypothetical protein F2Q68_00033140 [Brassica cretica]|uniref:Uncharacterized protein n=1 Tax=Brassica cretica TaxID=69181 RepID=A0A8S9GJP6_BRACR|nr:hypothetical protein F2Q68_00033140 [Brassica cretica]